jgi:hemolysin III
VLGGALYTLGGVVYAVRRPSPWPRVFGYHEIFHVLVVLGSTFHYSLVAIYVLPS